MGRRRKRRKRRRRGVSVEGGRKGEKKGRKAAEGGGKHIRRSTAFRARWCVGQVIGGPDGEGCVGSLCAPSPVSLLLYNTG